ncbi:MAG: DUF4132 domain-containing protein, partial [Acetatifactor sp.]|nr:DUF4132 domain-containing protein [Acetatifactor sp.]
VLARNKKQPADIIFSFSQDKSKEVREDLVDILGKAKGYEKNVREMLASQKVTEREVAIKVLAKWAGKQSGEKYVPVLKEALEKETSTKIRTLLAGVIPMDIQEPAKEDKKQAKEDKEAAKEARKPVPDIDIVKELHKGNKKRLLARAYETPFPKVHNKTGEEADEEYLQAILLAYGAMSLKDVMVPEDDPETGKKVLKSGSPLFVNSIAASLAQALNEEEFATYAGELLERWIAGGSDTRKRWVLYAAALHGNAETTERICQKLPEWAADSKTVAVEAIQALVFGMRPYALLFEDGIARKKYKVKGTRDAAEKTLKAVAARLGTTREGLLDKTVPDFGFDDKMRRWFDYGKRKFYVTITTAFETEVFDETGQKLKKLPAPGKQDDGEKAAAAYEEFKLLKKQIKEAASSQKIRLETALSDGREWSMEAWEDLFVKNPIMHPFAIGLIWGIYEDGKLVSSFRYMEDGSFNTEDGEEIHPMDEDSWKENISQKVIKIVHPLELPDETWRAWSDQLEDYEIIQPILQLDRPIYCMEEEEANQKKLDRFDGWKVDYDIFIKRLAKLGWRNTWYEDYGEYIYSKENDELSMRVDLEFKFHYQNGNATIYDAKFFKIEGDETPDDEDACLLKCVPERYFSEIVMQLDSAMEDNLKWRRQSYFDD